MAAYYNEIDLYAAQWLRNLIDHGHIAPGLVDERSIEDVRPSDLAGFDQCHFFAGIGVWSHALRLAGWPDDRSVWTGSCPCQPFSAAGKGAGFDDERHLWPAWHHLIKECRPPVILGEQVASKHANAWIDLVQDDMEALDYAFGAIPFPAAGVGAPHIRDRLYWMAYADKFVGRQGCADDGWRHSRSDAQSRPGFDIMADDDDDDEGLEGRSAVQQRADECASRPGGVVNDMANTGSERRKGKSIRVRKRRQDETLLETAGRSPVGGFWSNAEWVWCRDEKYRPVEPGTFPLAHGAPARVGRLRAYGNAICAPVAEVFIEAAMSSIAPGD